MISRMLLAAVLGAGPNVTEVQTEHYRVRSANIPAEQLGRMLEQLHADLTRFFGRAPEGRLEVELYANAEQYKQAIIADRQPFIGGGGYYAPSRRKAYLFVQPSQHFTRHLILHEATHQFHFIIAGPIGVLKSGWYVEGLAEYFGMHTWDGKKLRTGVVPAVTLEDYPAQALRLFDQLGPDLEAVIAGSKGGDRPLYWAMVHFAMHRYPRQLGALSLKLDRGEDALTAWRECLGPVTPEFKQRLRDWIEHHQQPWRDVWVAWQDCGESIEGKSSVTALAVLKNKPADLAAEMELVGGSLRAGLVFGFQSPADFSMVQVFAHRQAWIVRRANNQWQGVEPHPVPPAANGRNSVRLKQDGDSVTLWVNGQQIKRLPSKGQVGLNVDGCAVRFRVATKPKAVSAP